MLAQSVQQRTRDIGILMALGAQRADVAQLVLSQGLGMSLLGIGIAASAGVLLAVALAACWFSARRASRVDPLMYVRDTAPRTKNTSIRPYLLVGGLT
jgi:putative ABC transport system permease protein